MDPIKYYLGQYIGCGHTILGDVRDIVTPKFLAKFDAVWASPPCQTRSRARTLCKAKPSEDDNTFKCDLVTWCIDLATNFNGIFWIENVIVYESAGNTWGTPWNAAQFTDPPLQNRTRIIGGKYPPPETLRPFQYSYPLLGGVRLSSAGSGVDRVSPKRRGHANNHTRGVMPAVVASERHASKQPSDPDVYFTSPSGRAFGSRYYNRRMTLREVAFHMGLGADWEIPDGWRHDKVPYPFQMSVSKWEDALYTALGNGVPVFMAKAFGDATMREFLTRC